MKLTTVKTSEDLKQWAEQEAERRRISLRAVVDQALEHARRCAGQCGCGGRNDQ